MNFLKSIVDFVQHYSSGIPLEVYSFIMSILDEAIFIIPSPFVSMSIGTITEAQGRAFVFLFWVCLFGALGKTIGAWIIYFIADKAEDIIVTKWGKAIGVSHEYMEEIGKKLNGGWRDYVVLFVLRATPVIPSTPLSFGCGVIKLDLRVYLTATFLGSYVRGLFFAWLGYAGYAGYSKVVSGVNMLESIEQVVAVAAVIGVFLWWKFKTKKAE